MRKEFIIDWRMRPQLYERRICFGIKHIAVYSDTNINIVVAKYFMVAF